MAIVWINELDARESKSQNLGRFVHWKTSKQAMACKKPGGLSEIHWDSYYRRKHTWRNSLPQVQKIWRYWRCSAWDNRKPRLDEQFLACVDVLLIDALILIVGPIISRWLERLVTEANNGSFGLSYSILSFTDSPTIMSISSQIHPCSPSILRRWLLLTNNTFFWSDQDFCFDVDAVRNFHPWNGSACRSPKGRDN